MWFMRGETPRCAFFWSSKKTYNIWRTFVNGRFYYDFYEAQNSITFRNFLRNLFSTLDDKRKYIIILDNAGWHKTLTVKNLLSEYASWISVEHIPPYSPELNPIETCWKISKFDVTKSQYFENIDKMQDALENYWSKKKFMLNFNNYLCR